MCSEFIKPRGKIKIIFSLFIFASALAIFVNPASAGINVTDAEAIYEANLASVDIPTIPYPIENIFNLNEEVIFKRDLYSVNIPTWPFPLEYMFIVNKEALLRKNLLSVNIPTEPFPIKEMFIHLEDAKLYKELGFPAGLIYDNAPPKITNVNAKNITSNSATITWDTDEIAESLVKYHKEGGSFESKSDPLFVLNHSIELTGLLSGTTYHFVVNSTDRSGNSNESSTYEFTTSGETCSIGDLNSNGVCCDAGDLVLMKRASIGEIPADSKYDLNNNGIFADAGDLVLMKRCSIGEITLCD